MGKYVSNVTMETLALFVIYRDVTVLCKAGIRHRHPRNWEGNP